jgi:tetratricopeptide (TPR) repeat protein
VKEKPDRRWRAGKDYPSSVYETFELGLERVLAGHPELGVPPQPRAEELMGIMAYLAPDGIPLDLFPESLFSRDELSGLVAALNEAALLTRTRLPGGAPAVNVHRLVQRVMQVRLAKVGATVFAAAAVTLVADAFPQGDGDKDPQDVRSWPRCRLLEPHSIAALAHSPDDGDAAEKTGLLLNQYALHLKARADCAEAEPLYRRAIRVGEVALGPEHPNVASALNNLAQLLNATNRLEEAEPLLRRALAIDEKNFGADHPNVARDLNNLAWLLQHTNRLAEAEPLIHRVIAIVEKALGPHHPNVAISLSNLAQLLKATNATPCPRA